MVLAAHERSGLPILPSWEDVGRWGCCSVLYDHLRDSVCVGQNLAVPITQHRQSLSVQPVIPLDNPLTAVVAAINFDDELSGEADEVDDVASDWLLPAEMVGADLPGTETSPYRPLGVGSVYAQVLRASGNGGSHLLSSSHKGRRDALAAIHPSPASRGRVEPPHA